MKAIIKSFITLIISLLMVISILSMSEAYTVDSNGNYVLSKEEMFKLTKQHELNKLEIESLQKKLAVFQDNDLEAAIQQAMAGYEEIVDMKNLQIETLTELNNALNEQNKSLELELTKYKLKGAAYQTSSKVGWLAAFGLAIAWAVESN